MYVEKGKIRNLLDGFQSPVMNQNHFEDFCYRFYQFSHEILRDIQKNTLILSIFELEKCSFFLKLDRIWILNIFVANNLDEYRVSQKNDIAFPSIYGEILV